MGVCLVFSTALLTACSILKLINRAGGLGWLIGLDWIGLDWIGMDGWTADAMNELSD